MGQLAKRVCKESCPLFSVWQHYGNKGELERNLDVCIYRGGCVCVGVCACVCAWVCTFCKKKKDVGNQKHDGSTRHYNVC